MLARSECASEGNTTINSDTEYETSNTLIILMLHGMELASLKVSTRFLFPTSDIPRSCYTFFSFARAIVAR